MKMSLLDRGVLPHGLSGWPSKSMWTPWKTKRFGSFLMLSTPFMRKMSGPFRLEQLAHPVVELLRVEVAGDGDADAGHRLVVLVVGGLDDVEPVRIAMAQVVLVVLAVAVLVVAVRVVLAVLLVVVMVLVLVAAGLQELGFVFEDAVEVEALDVQHVVQVDVGVPGAVNAGDGVFILADALFERVEFLRRHEVGLVEEDHVGEGDLLLHLVLIPVRA